MNIYYLSTSAFSDNQMSTLQYLSQDHEITYAVILPYKNSNFTEDEIGEYCRSHSIRYIPFVLKRRFRDPRLIRPYWAILQSIKRTKPDIIYFANFDQLYLNAILLALNPNNTVIALHDVESHSGTAFSSLAGLSKRILLYRFRYFHTFSVIQQRLLQCKVPGKSVFNIPLPLLDFGLPANFTEKNDNSLNFLFFGNILPYKGLDLLIPAFKRVAARHPNARLTIAGRCPDWEENYAGLVDGCSQIDEHIRFIDNVEIPAFFAAASYLVLPYRDTTQSGPLMIAYNYTVPVLVSTANGFEEFTSEGVTGFRFDPKDSNDIERVLEKRVTSGQADREALKKRLADYIETSFSKEMLAEKYNRMFSAVAAEK